MDNLHKINPFAKKESHSPKTIVTYKVLTILSWLLAVIPSIYYSVESPSNKLFTIPGQLYVNPSGFTLNWPLVAFYFIVLYLLQIGYVLHLFSGDVAKVNAAASVGSHFIVNNLLHFAYVMLFAHAHFAWALVILLINFFNLSSLAFRHNTYARFIHAPVVSGPLAWTFVAIYSTGAIAIPHTNNLVARIFANIFIWSILAYGLFFLFAYKDYTMGLWLSVLSASLGVAQFQNKGLVQLQWIFAFVILAVLFSLSFVLAVAAWTGRDLGFGKKTHDNGDAERAPLLADN